MTEGGWAEVVSGAGRRVSFARRRWRLVAWRHLTSALLSSYYTFAVLGPSRKALGPSQAAPNPLLPIRPDDVVTRRGARR